MPFYTPQQLETIKRTVARKRRQKMLTAKGIEAPRSVEAQYYRDLTGIVKRLTNAVNAELLPVLAKLEPEYIQDSPSLLEYLNLVVEGIARQVQIAERTQERIAARMVNGTEVFNRNQFVNEINRAIGVSLSGIIKKEGVQTAIELSIAENIGLIKTIPEQYFERLRNTITKGINQGNDFFSIRKEILSLGQSTKKRARLIARDQVAKLNGALVEMRQQKLGVTHYFWRTSQDERVRDSHAAKEGDRFAWADPPADTGHPGQDIQCRCTAEPDLSGLLSLADLPDKTDLTGSPKQIAWAQDIKERRLSELKNLETLPIPPDHPAAKALREIRRKYDNVTEAAWWIEHDQTAVNVQALANEIAKGRKIRWPE